MACNHNALVREPVCHAGKPWFEAHPDWICLGNGEVQTRFGWFSIDRRPAPDATYARPTIFDKRREHARAA